MTGEILFYCGVALMVMALVMAIISIVIFSITGEKLKKKLEKDYGICERK
jgi:uncharacterized membrane protein